MKHKIVYKERRIFPCGNEGVMRRRWWKNTAGRQPSQWGGYAVAFQVTVCWNLGFHSTLFSIRM
jgi:hypothetical protein